MVKKAIIGSLGAIVVVVALVGVVATVTYKNRRGGSNVNGSTNPDPDALLTSTKSLEAFCAPTLYKDTCERTLKPALNGSANVKDVFNVSVDAIMKEIHSAIELTSTVFKNASSSLDKQAYAVCQSLFEDAVSHLEAVIVQSKDDILKNSNNIKTWLSSVLTMQWMCTEEISTPELKSKMDNGIVNATQLTSNALAIIDEVFSLFENIDLSAFSIQNEQRRLLRQEEQQKHQAVDAEGFPMWFPEEDRRLLGGKAGAPRIAPNAVVAKDGSGKFRTINDALKAMPKKRGNGQRYVIYVKAGVYKENVLVDKSMVNVFMYGDGSRKTIVTGNRGNTDGYTTTNTATFSVEGVGFVATNMGFSNTAGPQKHQAVALRVRADRCAFYKCRMDAYQDTLYVQYDKQFFRNCVISGTVDFIFGAASALIQNSLIIVRRGMDGQQNTITADGRDDPKQFNSIVIQNCRIRPDTRLFPDRMKVASYFGRPWKRYATTMIMESDIGDFIKPEGWLEWGGAEKSRSSTIQYAEYGNRGPGAGTSGRVKWPGFHVMNKKGAMRFTAAGMYQGDDQWIKATRIAYFAGFKY